MLPPESGRVAASQACEKQNAERQTLARPDRPARLELLDLFFRPTMESIRTRHCHPNALSWIAGHEARLKSPAEKPAHRFKERLGGERRRLAPIPPVGDRRAVDPRKRTFARRLDDLPENDFALLSRRRG
jgi:hypothetical protein